MAKQIIFRRGTTAQHASFTGANGEITVDTVKHVAVIHDGVTAGGWPQANAAQINANITALTTNAANQSSSITALVANAAAQSTAISQLQANAAAQQVTINAFTLASNATAILANINEVRSNAVAAHSNIALLWGNATVQSEAITLANSNIASLQSTVANISTANLQSISGSLLPSTNITYDLGSPSKRWRDLYLSGTTINLGGSTIGASADGGITVPTVTMGNITFTDTGVQASDGSIFPQYTFGNITLTSDGIVIGSPDVANPIYLSTADGVPQFRMGEQTIGVDDNGNFVFPGVTETQDDVYQIVDMAYQGGANLALDSNASLYSQVAWLDKLTWRLDIAQDLPYELASLGNPWVNYRPFNNNIATSPLVVDYTAYENGNLAFGHSVDNGVYTYTAAQANIAGGNIMVTTTLTEYAPGQYQSSTDPNDWFEVNWAPVFAKGKTAGNVNFNSGNVEVWNNIGVSSVPGTVTEAIDSLANIIAVSNAITAPFEPANPTYWTAPVSTIGDALNQLAERIYNLENP